MAAAKNSKLTSASNEARKFDKTAISNKATHSTSCNTYKTIAKWLFTTKTAVAKGVVRENITHTLKKFLIFLGFKLFYPIKTHTYD